MVEFTVGGEGDTRAEARALGQAAEVIGEAGVAVHEALGEVGLHADVRDDEGGVEASDEEEVARVLQPGELDAGAHVRVEAVAEDSDDLGIEGGGGEGVLAVAAGGMAEAADVEGAQPRVPEGGAHCALGGVGGEVRWLGADEWEEMVEGAVEVA